MSDEMKTIQRGKPAKSQKGQRGRKPKAKVVPELVEGLTAGNEVEFIEIKNIDLDDTTWRFRVSLRVNDLKESIEKNGQQLPVILRKVEGAGKFQIISGFRRITAVNAIGWPTVHAIVLGDVSDEEAFRLSVLENEKRKTYSDLDRAYAITKYRQMGNTVDHIAKEIFGLSRKQLERLQNLAKLPDFMQEAIEDAELSATTALVLKQLHDNSPEGAVDLKAWTARAINEKLSVRDLRAAVLASFSAKPSQLSLFSTKQNANSGTVIHFRAIKVNLDSLADGDRAKLVADLDALLAQFRH